MRLVPVVILGGALALASITSACKSTDGPNRSQRNAARMDVNSFRSRLGLIQPQIERTSNAATTMLTTGLGNPQGSAANFQRELAQLRTQSNSVVASIDELRRVGYDQYFLGTDRTSTTSDDPAVTSSREQYGLIGDYMVSLRTESRRLMGLFDSISEAVSSNPSEDGILGARPAIAAVPAATVSTQSVINLLIAELDRVQPTRPR